MESFSISFFCEIEHKWIFTLEFAKKEYDIAQN